jgi:3-hydroxyisobutyrate dehydrogenase
MLMGDGRDNATPPRIKSVGFIGVGNQGAPIARRIAGAGWPLMLWARRPEVLGEFASVATSSESAEALASASDLLCLCVVDDAGVCELIDRTLPAMRPGSLVAILSTIHPDTCVRIADRAADRGISVIDAPVSGGAEGAAAGTMAVMMGGTDQDCARAEPVFRSFGRLIMRLGDVGAGQRAKLVNNALLAAILDVTQDARETGAALGLDPAALDAVLAASSGNSFGLQVLSRLPDLCALANGARLLRKDVGLLQALCDGSGLMSPPMIAAGTRFLDRFDTNA